jgi:hypothetical protein
LGKWTVIREARKLFVSHCEICGSHENLVGHHLISKKLKKYEVPELCQIRCRDCEVRLHREFPHGNRPQDELIIKRYILVQELRNQLFLK